jgi:drug/metabolite transporter (DMT)-like permease
LTEDAHAATGHPRIRAAPLPYLALVLGLAGLGLSAIFVKWANVPGPVSGFYRVGIAAVVMALPFSIQVRRVAPLSPRHVWFAVIAGLFFACNLAMWNTAVLMTNAANATLFGNTSPFWVALGAMVLFKEKLRPAFWAGLVLALVGVTVILGGDFLIHPVLGTGDVIALLSGFFYGSFFLATQRARERLSSLVTWWVAAAVSTVGLLTLSLVFQQHLVGYTAESYYSLFALALVTQVFGWLALNYALAHLPASLVSPTLLGQPVITAIAGVPLLGQALSLVQIGGGVLVLAGIYIVHKSRRTTKDG